MSTLKVDNLQTTGGAALYPVRAWVNFNGTGTVAIRASGNVSSISDLGTGKYQISFSSNMADANYAPAGAASKSDGNNDGNQHCQCNGYNNGSSWSNTTSSTRVVISYPSNAGQADTGVITLNVTR